MHTDWSEVRVRRLARHFLLDRAPAGKLVGVVGGVCGIHAQVLTAGELSLGIRVNGITRTDVRRALWEERSLVKTWGVRGTVHLYPAGEVAMWVAAARASGREQDQRRLKFLGITPALLETLIEEAGRAVDGRRLTLKELGAELVRRLPWSAEHASTAFGAGSWPKWRVGVGHAAGRGLLVFGPNRGPEVTFVSPREWLGGWPRVDVDAAVVEVLRRYLRTYGPSTANEFAQWLAIHPRRARAALAEIAGELEEVEVEGEPRLDLPGEPAKARRSVRLLPHFDAYLRGFHPRRELTAGHAERSAGGTGQAPVLLVDGMVAGVWQRQAKGRRLQVRVDTFVKLSKAQLAELEGEARRVSAFDGLEAELSLGPVRVRAHL